MCSNNQDSNGSNDVVMVVMVVINWFFSCVQALTGAVAPTPPDNKDESDLRPDIEHDQPRSDSPEIGDQGHHPQPGRQKASAHLHPFHPPTVIAKLCSTAFKKNTRRILEDVRGNYAVPRGTQPEAMVSDELRVWHYLVITICYYIITARLCKHYFPNIT